MNITMYSLSDYNNGVLVSNTFDLDRINSEEEWNEALAEWLQKVTDVQDDGEVREEYIVCDSEDVPSQFVGEWDIDADFWEYKEAMASSGYDEEVFKAAMDCDVQVSDVEEAYAGSFNSDEDFAYDMAESCGQIDHDAGWPNNCIDWERAARDLMYDYSCSNGHYFRNL